MDIGSHHVIRNQLQLSEDVQLVAQRLDVLETQVETLIRGQQLILGTLNQITKKDAVRRKPPAQKKQRKKSQQPSLSDVSKLLHLPEALQKNIQRFTETVLFDTTSIPDDLVSKDCLSEDECSTLLSKSSKKDQIRLLICKIKARGPLVIEKFLKIIEKEYPHLPTEVNKSLEVIVKEYKHKPVCVICVMQATVDLRDIGDHLWEEKIISDDIYKDIIESDNLYQKKPFIWSKIINSLNGYPGEAKDILMNALRKKYGHIVEYLNENPDRQSLSCSCCSRRRLRPRPLASDFGSQTDMSTTSYAIPNIIDEDDNQSVASSQELPGSNLPSYDLLDNYDNIQDMTSSVTGGNADTMNDERADNQNNKNQLSECFLPQAEKVDAKDVELETRQQPFLILGESPDKHDRGTDNNERQELKHSVSTVSNTSTVCNSMTPDSDAAADITDLAAGIKMKHQEDIISNEIRCNTEEVNDGANETSTREIRVDTELKDIKIQLPADDEDSPRETQANDVVKDIPKYFPPNSKTTRETDTDVIAVADQNIQDQLSTDDATDAGNNS